MYPFSIGLGRCRPTSDIMEMTREHPLEASKSAHSIATSGLTVFETAERLKSSAYDPFVSWSHVRNGLHLQNFVISRNTKRIHPDVNEIWRAIFHVLRLRLRRLFGFCFRLVSFSLSSLFSFSAFPSSSLSIFSSFSLLFSSALFFASLSAFSTSCTSVLI